MKNDILLVILILQIFFWGWVIRDFYYKSEPRLVKPFSHDWDDK